MQKEKSIILRFSHSRWTRTLLRMLGGLLLLGLAFLGALFLQRRGFDPTIASTPMLLVIALVALFWGTISALVTLLVSIISLDYLVLDPVGTFHFPTWKVFIQLFPFLLSGGLIAVLTAQRERARHLAERAERDAERYADEVEQDTILREMTLSLTADALQEKVTALAKHSASLSPEQTVPAIGSSQALGEASSEVSSNEQSEELQRLISDLPLLKTIHSSMLFFDQSPPYDLYEIAQMVIEEQRRGSGRVITLEPASSPVMVKQGAEHISVALISLLRHALDAFPAPEGVSVHLSRDETTLSIQICRTRAVHEHGQTPQTDQYVLRNKADLWWVICQVCVKRQGGQLLFREREAVWVLIFFHT
jgi:K+-sensing histidine kinase KdpD